MIIQPIINIYSKGKLRIAQMLGIGIKIVAINQKAFNILLNPFPLNNERTTEGGTTVMNYNGIITIVIRKSKKSFVIPFDENRS